MPVTKYSYDTAMDTGAAATLIDTLTTEIDADATLLGGGFTADHIDVNVEADKTDIYMSDALPAPEKAALDAVVAAHQGEAIDFDLGCAFSSVKTDLVVAEDATWQEIEGVVIAPDIFKKKDLADVLVVVSGEHNGDGGQLRLIEGAEGEADVDILAVPHEFADTLGAWKRFQVFSDVTVRPGGPTNAWTYQFRCRLNGAVGLSLRYTTVSFILNTPIHGHG